jgi:hypothetical protein
LILTAEGKILDGEHAKRLAARIAQLHQGIKCGCPLLRFGIDNLDWEQQHEVVSCGGQPSSRLRAAAALQRAGHRARWNGSAMSLWDGPLMAHSWHHLTIVNVRIGRAFDRQDPKQTPFGTCQCVIDECVISWHINLEFDN